jgi:hypothetical protein
VTDKQKAIVPNLIVGISGDPKTGKTYLACTFPKPLVLFSFDYGADRVIRSIDTKEIEVIKYETPIVDTMMPKPYAQAFWAKFKKDYEAVLARKDVATIVIDTGTALYEIARHTRAEELKVMSLPKECYGEVYTRLTALIQAAQRAGKNVVWTHYLKDSYKDGEPTGETKTDGYKYVDGVVDIVLNTELRQTKMGSKIDNKVITTVQRCGFDFRVNGMEFENFSYKDLLALLGL